ncbi:MAG: sucrose synthase [Ignavibacteria bacterium]|jgi:sucrose synthase
MVRKVFELIENNKNELFGYLNALAQSEKFPMVKGDLVELLNEYEGKGGKVSDDVLHIIDMFQEVFKIDHTLYAELRIKIADSRFVLISLEDVCIEEIPVKEYLLAKEEFVHADSEKKILTINFSPFYEKMPKVRDPKNIGQGVEYLNKFLSSNMFNDIDKWRGLLVDFLKQHSRNSEQFIINDRIKDADDLLDNISKAVKKLKTLDDKTPLEEFRHALQTLGFEKGLGSNAEAVSNSLELLNDLLNSPDHLTLKEFIGRIPMVFNIVTISIHGYFAQKNVLGMPDTGGQVVYILDQVKALEKSLTESVKKSGLNITPKIIILTRLIPNAENTSCNKRLEKVYNTKNVWILRVPFREHNPEVTNNWISRFEIWPYLDEFADDAYNALKAEFNGKPDLIIGNYSDGNIVAHLLGKRFQVTKCCISHALEKSKYLFSDIYWRDLERFYNFSVQFTADLIAMNSSDFQITSTFQEIAGTENTVGQYESHKHFTLPGLFRVQNGVDISLTKFNILSPGVNERIFFPYTKQEKRIHDVKSNLEELVFNNVEDAECFGHLDNPELMPIFSMARLDKTKNLTAIVRWFGKSKLIQEKCNVILVAGKIDVAHSNDNEEKEQIAYMHDLINEYDLHGKIRWLGKLFRKDETGEIYRIIADRKGLFIQPSLFEGFGLTVLEAMLSGLPVAATKYGGPLEIIENGKNGFHIDPVDDKDSTEILSEVINKFSADQNFWHRISENSIKRVKTSYTWKKYADNLISFSKIFGFWKFVTNMDTKNIEAYLDVLYYLLYKPMANNILLKHNTQNEE